jgi:hypothetical protein
MLKPKISFMCGTKIGTETKDFEIYFLITKLESKANQRLINHKPLVPVWVI